MQRIYISPSTQEHNIGVTPFTTEEAEMNKIADLLMPLLDRDGRYEFKRNLPSMTPNQIAQDSNNFKADLHLPIHSNAGGGEGTEVFAYGPGTNSERFAKALYKHIAPLSPGKDRGIKFNKSFYEVGHKVSATSALIELDFHDNAAGAAWIASNHQAIAEALYKSICDYYQYDYRALVVATAVANPVPTPETIKRTIAFESPAKYPAVDPDVYIAVRVRTSLIDELVKGLKDSGFSTKKIDLP